jgi:hypothetical protein
MNAIAQVHVCLAFAHARTAPLFKEECGEGNCQTQKGDAELLVPSRL